MCEGVRIERGCSVCEGEGDVEMFEGREGDVRGVMCVMCVRV